MPVTGTVDYTQESITLRLYSFFHSTNGQEDSPEYVNGWQPGHWMIFSILIFHKALQKQATKLCMSHITIYILLHEVRTSRRVLT